MGSLLALFWPACLAAQDNVTVGNPQLRNFQLQGERTTPPAQPQPAVPTLPATKPPAATAAPTTTAPASTTRPTREPSRATTAPERTTARATAKALSRTKASAPEQPKPPTHAAPVAATPAPVPVAQPPVAAPQPEPLPAAPSAAAPESPAPSTFSWLWLALPALIVLAGLGFFFLRRASATREDVGEERIAGDQPASELLLDAVATPEPAAAPAEAPRPWLELDIEPDRAAATPSEASVHYDLVITNVGGETARNIRIDTRMFNAADEQPIGAFLGGPIHRHSGSPHVTLPPGETLRIAAAVQMKADDVQVIELQGRRIFVPSVAANVAYDWGQDGQGRTSKSWLVGRKAEKPSDRMGAFRVDLGPRIYRSVGRKDTKRVMV